MRQAEKHDRGSSICKKEVKVTEKYLDDLIEKSKKMFANFEKEKMTHEKEKNYFKSNFNKSYYKFHKSLSKFPGNLVISNCGMPM